MNCKKCGSNIENGQRFCEQCGYEIEDTPRTQTYKDVKDSKIDLLSILATVFGIISIFLCFLWYVSIPLGIIGIVLAETHYRKKNTKRIDYKMLLNIIGVLLALIIIVIGLFFSMFDKEYSNNYYTIRYDTNWSIEENSKKMKLMYKDSDNIYLSYVSKKEFLENKDMSKEEDRKSLYNNYYKLYDSKAKAEGYYLTSEINTFYKVRGTKDTYIAYISYSSLDEFGRFYIVVSQKDNTVLTFRSYSDSKYTENIMHDKVLKLLEEIKFQK